MNKSSFTSSLGLVPKQKMVSFLLSLSFFFLHKPIKCKTLLVVEKIIKQIRNDPYTQEFII